VARNRQRAKERRSRRADAPAPPGSRAHGREDSPSPLQHATPDAELAEAQLALGRPELAPDEQDGGPDVPGSEPGDDELDAFAEEDASAHAAIAAREKVPVGPRLAAFVRGSWAELQRVQWPDRRQVMQATGVVIGFVIVAGVYLGVADAIAGKIVNWILK
jgi:preprotein translocase subunit SecE